MSDRLGEYILVTPAHNEEACLERTIKCVVAQTYQPRKWAIVSDGSSDQTDEIAMQYEKSHPFIEFVPIKREGGHNFGSKAGAFWCGYRRIQGCKHDFVGNLDADVAIGDDYYERILNGFRSNDGLGLAGGLVIEEVKGQRESQRVSLNSVAGAVQLFRREVFEQIGGYLALPWGGIDSAAEILVRRNGWEVRTFPEMKVFHHGPVRTGTSNVCRNKFRQGVTDYLLGYHPVFQVASCTYRSIERPYLVGAFCTLSGYSWAMVRRYQKVLPRDAVMFLRAEQKQRLFGILGLGRSRA